MIKNHRNEESSSRSRHNLAGEHAFTDIGQLILLTLFLAVWITDSFLFHYTDFLAQFVPLYIRLPMGLAVLIVSAFFALTAHRTVFGDTVESSTLLTGGVFGVVRHPMYFGSWLFFVGLMISTLSLASALVCAAILIFYYGVSRSEEKLLAQKFGPEYQEYKKRVPMFFPLKLGKRRHSV
jgi:protein-S-isoprenylcysteine O-methyltransferase Ste14